MRTGTGANVSTGDTTMLETLPVSRNEREQLFAMVQEYWSERHTGSDLYDDLALPGHHIGMTSRRPLRVRCLGSSPEPLKDGLEACFPGYEPPEVI
jgi:hypothetical protein